MLTPQDLQEVYFEKARFGGYVMESVDNFLEPLMNDYLTLYKENAVLKSKMRLLVERLETYRGKEAELKAAMENAEKTRAELLAKTERECAELLKNAESSARSRSRDMDNAVLSEQERLNRAKAATAAFIEAVEAELAKQQAALAALKGLDLEPQPVAKPAPEPKRAYDFEAEADEPKAAPAPQPVPTLSDPAPAAEAEPELDIAEQIEQNVEKLMQNVPTTPADLAKTKVMPAIDFKREDKFADLQFGKNYDPTK